MSDQEWKEIERILRKDNFLSQLEIFEWMREYNTALPLDLRNGFDLGTPNPQPTPHRCPVCCGNGKVPNGFYRQTSGNWSSSDATPETCQSCEGTGVVWSKH